MGILVTLDMARWSNWPMHLGNIMNLLHPTNQPRRLQGRGREMDRIKIIFSSTVGDVIDDATAQMVKTLAERSTCPLRQPALPVESSPAQPSPDSTLQALIRAEVALQMQAQTERVLKLISRRLAYGAES